MSASKPETVRFRMWAEHADGTRLHFAGVEGADDEAEVDVVGDPMKGGLVGSWALWAPSGLIMSVSALYRPRTPREAALDAEEGVKSDAEEWPLTGGRWLFTVSRGRTNWPIERRSRAGKLGLIIEVPKGTILKRKS